MKKYRFILVFILFNIVSFSTQAKLKKLDLVTDNTSLASKIYSHIQIIDDRPDIEKKDLAIDEKALSNKLNEMLVNTTGYKTLVIQLNKIYLLKDLSTKKNLYLIQARAYEKNDKKNKSYFWINTLNTSLPNNYTDKETNQILSSTLTDFINEQLNLVPESYSAEYETSDFDNIPFLEKASIAAYQADTLKDGIYITYASFANQKPSAEISSYKFNKDTSLKDVFYLDKQKGKEKKVGKKDIYGVVIDGNFFVQNKNKYVAAYKDDDNDFYFRSLNVSSNAANISFGFGLIGSLLIPTTSKTEDNTIVIDHLSGEFSLKSKKVVKTRESIFYKKPKVLKEEIIEGDGSLKRKW